MKTKSALFLLLAILLSGCAMQGNTQNTTPVVLPTALPTLEPENDSPPQITPETPVPATDFLPSDNFRIGTRVTTQISPAMIEFINEHYAYVMTPILSEEARNAIQGPDLILYRSIQGTWEGFNQFDWAHIDATEGMFEHHHGERILTLWNSWLMNADDLVDADAPDAMDHWINYYAVTASEQIYEYGYDGLFIDSASHKLSESAVLGKMPDDYDAEEWYRGRVEGLAFIKSYLPDKSVVFNGLHSRAGAENSLANTDGGMWEVFAFKPQSGEYFGEEAWREVIELAARNNKEKNIILVLKEQPDLDHDIQKRVFTVASYLLVSNGNVILSMTSLEHVDSPQPLYYPEYSLDLGKPLGDYTFTEDGYAIRKFENGLVLVNPSAVQTVSYVLDQEYLRVIPAGGGEVSPDGSWEGSLTYEAVSGEVELPPLSGQFLLYP